MMVHDISHDKLAGSDLKTSAATAQLARQQAIQQIQRRRRFRIRVTTGTLGMMILTIIWALTEYHNAGGWPASGFSQSSAIPNVWNYWIIYPAIAWALLTAADTWRVYGRKPIPETEIRREIDRQAGLAR